VPQAHPELQIAFYIENKPQLRVYKPNCNPKTIQPERMSQAHIRAFTPECNLIVYHTISSVNCFSAKKTIKQKITRKKPQRHKKSDNTHNIPKSPYKKLLACLKNPV